MRFAAASGWTRSRQRHGSARRRGTGGWIAGGVVAVPALVLAWGLAGCSGSGGSASSSTGGGGASSSSISPGSNQTGAPVFGVDGRALPRADRPVVDLRFDLTTWRTGTAAGTEDVRFMPDLRTCELVFRLWPNAPRLTAYGDLLSLTGATVQGAVVVPELETDGGVDDVPTLARLPLSTCVDPGSVITVHLSFTLKFGVDAAERVGRAGDGSLAWLGTAFPLLAWEHGVGWMQDPALAVDNGTAGSEAFDLHSLDVLAPHADQVLGVGRLVSSRRPANGPAEYRFSAPAVRDVLVTVGRFRVSSLKVGSVRVHLATRSGLRTARKQWLAAARASLPRLSALLGPFPYDDVWLTVAQPAADGGIGYPGAALLGDVRPHDAPGLVSLELAHSYFSGLVGADQARDPWLDDALAGYAAAVAGRTPAVARPARVRTGRVGEPMSYWAAQPQPDSAYLRGVREAGTTALLNARKASGAKVFDAAIRHYLDLNANRIARPADLATALAALPAALRILRTAGALPPA